MRNRDPYSDLPATGSFVLTSDDFTDGQHLDVKHASPEMGVPEGANLAPHLSWSEVPEGTKSFVLTCLDADAPTPTGFWHLCVTDVPASVTSLPTGWKPEDVDRACAHPNDSGQAGWLGVAPPAGDGVHRYMFAVSALDVEHLEVDAAASPALVSAQLLEHCLGRAVLTGLYEVKN